MSCDTFKKTVESHRLTLVPPLFEGEPLYIKDTKKLYLGDGVTPGGLEVIGSSGVLQLLSTIEDVISDSIPEKGEPVYAIDSQKIYMGDGHTQKGLEIYGSGFPLFKETLFLSKNNVDQSIPVSSDTLITWEKQIIDDTNGFSYLTNDFTFKKIGLYYLKVKIGLLGIPDTKIGYLKIFKNGIEILSQRYQNIMGSVLDYFFEINTFLPIENLFDSINVFVYQNSAISLYVEGENSYLKLGFVSEELLILNADLNSIDQSIPQSAETKIVLDNIVEDNSNFSYDTALDKWTSRIPGYYLICLNSGMLNLDSNSSFLLRVKKNEILVHETGNNLISVSSDSFLDSFFMVKMDGDSDYLEFFVEHDSGTSKLLSGNVMDTYLNIYYVPNLNYLPAFSFNKNNIDDPVTVVPNTDVAVNWTQVSLDNYNELSYYNGIGSRIYPEISGTYKIDAKLTLKNLTINKTCQIKLFKNGVFYAAGLLVIATSTGDVTCLLNITVPVASNKDYLELKIKHTNTVSRTIFGNINKTYLYGSLEK